MRHGAENHRWNSEQSVGTPKEFIDAVENRFGRLTVDLAATSKNSCCDKFLGPGGIAENSLEADWELFRGENCWLNPPFGNVRPWAEKCHSESNKLGGAGRIYMLCPASVGTRWFYNFVHDCAWVYFLSPRIKFVGHASAFPKDLMLCVYHRNLGDAFQYFGYDVWRWK